MDVQIQISTIASYALYIFIIIINSINITGFNKRLIDDLLEESLTAMGYTPCRDPSLTSFIRLRNNIEMLLDGTVPKHQLTKFRGENKTTEDMLFLLTDEKKEKE